jgi:uncharacterized protein
VVAHAPTTPVEPAPTGESPGFMGRVKDWMFGTRRRQGAIETMTKSTMRTVGTKLGNQILRGVLGGMAGGRKR